MKIRRAFMLMVSLGLALAVQAQTVEFVVLDRQVNFVQTTAGSASLAGATPYEFVVDLNGQNLDGLTFTFQKPGDAITNYSSYPKTSSPVTEWQAPGPMGSGQFSSMAALQAAFPHGNYAIQTNLGSTSALSIPNLIGSTNDGFANTPFLTGTQNGNPVTWSGNMMIVDPTMELTLTSTTFTTNYATATGRIGMWVSGNSFNQEKTNETAPNNFVFNSDTVQMQILANGLSAGTYSGALEFNNVVGSGLVDLSGVYGGSAKGISVYTAYTNFQIQAIPEPSTYAAIVGAVAMAGAMLRRRWRTV